VKKREKWLKSAQKLQKKCEISGLGHFFAFEIGPLFEDSEKLTRRDLRSLRDKFASSLKLGLIGFVLHNRSLFIVRCSLL